MKNFLLPCLAAMLLTACAGNGGPTADVSGPRSPLANPADNTLNSPTTGPSSAGLPGGPVGSPPNSGAALPLATGRR